VVGYNVELPKQNLKPSTRGGPAMKKYIGIDAHCKYCDIGGGSSNSHMSVTKMNERAWEAAEEIN